jgi:lipoate-protein ligase B
LGFTVNKKQTVHLVDGGLISFQKAFEWQMTQVKRVAAGDGSVVMVCEHPPVITLGRMFKTESLLLSFEQLQQEGLDVARVDRGGDVTLHAPGQLIVYPILDLNLFGRDLRGYLRQMEKVGQDVLRNFSIDATYDGVNTGLWVGPRKIMSIGIGVKRWIAYHGMGLNVHTDLSLFRWMNPCGLKARMTSMENELRRDVSMSEVKSKLIDCFCRDFQLEYQTIHAIHE